MPWRSRSKDPWPYPTYRGLSAARPPVRDRLLAAAVDAGCRARAAVRRSEALLRRVEWGRWGSLAGRTVLGILQKANSLVPITHKLASLAASAAILSLGIATAHRMEALRGVRPAPPVSDQVAAPALPGEWPREPVMPRLVQMPRLASQTLHVGRPLDEGGAGFGELEPLPPVGPPLLIEGPGDLALPGERHTAVVPRRVLPPVPPPPEPLPPSVIPAPAARATASAERPLMVAIHVPAAPEGFAPGGAVQVRVASRVDCYLVLIRVDSAGKATLEFPFRLDSPGQAGQVFDRVVRVGAPGSELLVAVASIHPLTTADALAALKLVGMPAELGRVEGGAAAWEAALAFLAAAPGASAAPRLPDWARHEWYVGVTTFTVRAPQPAAPDSAPTPPPAAP